MPRDTASGATGRTGAPPLMPRPFLVSACPSFQMKP